VERQDEWLNYELNGLSAQGIPEELDPGSPPGCPLCGAPVQSLRFVRRLAGAITLAWQCPCCGIGGLVSISTAPQTACELTPLEQIAFAGLPPISEADAQRIRRLIRTHQGDLRDLL